LSLQELHAKSREHRSYVRGNVPIWESAGILGAGFRSRALAGVRLSKSAHYRKIMNVTIGYLLGNVESITKGSRSENWSCPNALVTLPARPCAGCAFLPGWYTSSGSSSRPELLIPEGDEAEWRDLLFQAWTATERETKTEAAPGERFAVPTFTKKRKGGPARDICMVIPDQRSRFCAVILRQWSRSLASDSQRRTSAPLTRLKAPLSRKEREKGRSPALVCGESMGQPPTIIIWRQRQLQGLR